VRFVLGSVLARSAVRQLEPLHPHPRAVSGVCADFPDDADHEGITIGLTRLAQVELSHLPNRESRGFLSLHSVRLTTCVSVVEQFHVCFCPREGSGIRLVEVQNGQAVFEVVLSEVMEVVVYLLQAGHHVVVLLLIERADLGIGEVVVLEGSAQVWDTVAGVEAESVCGHRRQTAPFISGIAVVVHPRRNLQQDLLVRGRTEEPQMTVAHAALCEVGCVVLQELADVGQRLPVHHSRRLLGVIEGVRLADGVRQFGTIEAVVVSK
jgi:hypothetical protein